MEYSYIRKRPFEKIIVFIIAFTLFYYIYINFKPSKNVPFSWLNNNTPMYEALTEGGSDSDSDNESDIGELHESFVEGIGIASVPLQNQDFTLANYMIKGAYNAAFDGTKFTTDQLKKVLNAGCRMLDFEIMLSGEGIPIIANSTDVVKMSTTNYSYLFLKDAMDTIASMAFSTVANPNDPLFLRFRFFLRDASSSRVDFYNRCADVIKTLNARFYKDTINSNTMLSDIMGKIIIVVDKSTINDFTNYCSQNGLNSCVFLKDIVNIQTNSSEWITMTYDNVTGLPPVANDDGSITMPHNLKPVIQLAVPVLSTLPQNATEGVKMNPSPCDLLYYVTRCSCQTILYMHYLKDTGNNELQFYNAVFDTNSAAILPMGVAVNHILNKFKGSGAQTANYCSSSINCSNI